jgi:hypothetical protein
MVVRILIITMSWWVVAGCGPEEGCEQGSMRDSPGGLELRASEHPTGWGQEPCAACHVEAVIHREGCTEDVDLEAVRAEVEERGEGSCQRCHGDNGVER